MHLNIKEAPFYNWCAFAQGLKRYYCCLDNWIVVKFLGPRAMITFNLFQMNYVPHHIKEREIANQVHYTCWRLSNQYNTERVTSSSHIKSNSLHRTVAKQVVQGLSSTKDTRPIKNY